MEPDRRPPLACTDPKPVAEIRDETGEGGEFLEVAVTVFCTDEWEPAEEHHQHRDGTDSGIGATEFRLPGQGIRHRPGRESDRLCGGGPVRDRFGLSSESQQPLPMLIFARCRDVGPAFEMGNVARPEGGIGVGAVHVRPVRVREFVEVHGQVFSGILRTSSPFSTAHPALPMSE